MSKNKKVLVLGANGMLGHTVSLYLREKDFAVTTLTNSRKLDSKSISMNVLNKEEFENFLSKNEYDVIVNAIGVLQKTSEDRKDLSTYINSFLPHQLEYIYEDSKTKIIHCSTDCVFSGKNGPYKENAFQDGEIFYDKSKALGEIINNKDLTFRQSIIGPDFNENGTGLFNWFMKQKEKVSGFDKAVWNGVTTLELAKGIEDAINQDLTGLYHLVPKQNITKYELLKLFNEKFNRKLLINKDSENMNINKTLINTRTDFNHIVPNYEIMIKEMKEWVDNHKELYPHYFKENLQ